MNCLDIRYIGVKYITTIKEPYKIEITVVQADNFIPELLVNGTSISYCNKIELEEDISIYSFSCWVEDASYIIIGNEKSRLYTWEEHRPISNIIKGRNER